MKYSCLALLLFATVFTNIATAQAPAIQWQKCLGGSGTDTAQAILSTADGGYIVAGYTTSNDGDVSGNHGRADYLVVKLNSSGNVEWRKCFGGVDKEQAYSIASTLDGGYIIAGYSYSNDGDVTGHRGSSFWSDCWLVKISSTGLLQWQKSLGGSQNDLAFSVQQTSDGGYIMAGATLSADGDVSGLHGQTNRYEDYWIVKLNSIGTIQWQRCLGGSLNDRANSVKQTPDGGFIVLGSAQSSDGDVTEFHDTNSDYWVLKLSSSGTILWQNCYGGWRDEYGMSIQLTTDGGFILGGRTSSDDRDVSGNHYGASYNFDYWILKLDNAGNIDWQKCLGGTGMEDFGSIEQTRDGGYIVAGTTFSVDGDVDIHNTANSIPNYWVVQLSSTGNIIWKKSYGGTNRDQAGCIHQTVDGGYIIAGASGSNNGDVSGNHGGSFDCWVVKLEGIYCTPSINFSASSTTICSGNPVTFTATAANAGSNPVFQWKLNGINVGTNSSTYISSSLANKDNITCELTSNAPCASGAVVTNNLIGMTVYPSPVVTISGDTCAGSLLSVSNNVSPVLLTWTFNGTTQVATHTAGFNPNATTVAGGNGSGSGKSQLNYPNRFYIDAGGNIYIPDMLNNRVQKWAPGATSGVTVAGGNGAGAAGNQFNRPTSVSMDSQGNLYITDQTNNRIQKWAPGADSGVTFVSGLALPTGLFINSNDDIYVSEQNSSRVTKFPSGSTTGITVAGGNGYGTTPYQLSTPTGIFVDASGNVYVCDTDNNRVQKWAPGALSGVTVAGGFSQGSGSTQLSNPLGIFGDSYGNIYIADYNNARVQKWTPGAISGITIAGGNGLGSATNQLSLPAGIWVNASGDLFVSDVNNHRVQKFSTLFTQTYVAASPGNYTATIISINGCTTTSNTIAIVALKTPQVSITSNTTTVCSGFPVVFTATGLYGGTSPLFQWKINGINAGSNIGDPTFSPAGLKAGDVVNCIMTSNTGLCLTSPTASGNAITIDSTSLQVAAVSIMASNTSACAGSAVDFTATPVNGGSNPSYVWTINGIANGAPGNHPVFSTTALNDGDRVNCIMTSSANLCPAALTASGNAISIRTTAVPVTSLSISASDTLICAGSAVSFSSIAANEGSNPVYQWKVNGINAGSGNPVYSANALKNGDIVSCSLISSMQCAILPEFISNSIRMTVDDIPVITARRDTVIFLGSSIRLNTMATGNVATYRWSPASTLDNSRILSPIATPVTTTTYALLAITAGNCQATRQVTVSTITQVIIPNAFSPNNDGINDAWVISGLSSTTDCSVQVYNRNGQLLFQSNGYFKPWNGTSNGSPLPVATYYYIVRSKSFGTRSGAVTILK